jgi:transcriptional regulator with XRE-family HTH domain
MAPTSTSGGSKLCDVENAKDVAPAIVGRRVRQLRLERGLSQMELAERSDVHRTYVSSLESGQRNVSVNLLFRLADGLGVPVRELFPA